MNSLQEMAFIFDYSAKKLNLFKEQLANDAVARTNIEGRQKRKTLCETRWLRDRRHCIHSMLLFLHGMQL